MNLFSGRSRPGDLTEELFKAGLECGVLVIVESWDTVHTMDHDLTDLQKAINLLQMVLSGWFDGGHGGPPCNTFTALLFKPPGPLPARDRQHLWGFPNSPHGGNLTLPETSECFQHVLRTPRDPRETSLNTAIREHNEHR